MPGIQISNQTGSHVIARDLAEVWVEAQRMTGEVIDPLDPRFIGQGGVT